MIDHFLRDASRVLSCPFWSTVLQYSKTYYYYYNNNHMQNNVDVDNICYKHGYECEHINIVDDDVNI